MKVSDIVDRVGKDSKTVEFTLNGWIDQLRASGKKLMFVVLRDDTGLIQVCLNKKCIDTIGSETVSRLRKEACISVKGVAHVDERAPYVGIEIRCTDIKILGDAEPLDALNSESGTYAKLEKRHLVLRRPTLANVMKVRAYVTHFFEDFMWRRGVTHTTPPTMTQQEVEGGSTLFKFKYYDKDAVLTQSSQLYLETFLPSLGDVYCLLPSYRSEKSATRRHLSEFTHLEVELGFIDFEDLLCFIEQMIEYVINSITSDPKMAGIISQLWKDAGKDITETLNKPFKPRRMKYKDAIEWLNKHEVKFKESDGSERDYVYGDDIPAAPEREMVDTIGEPVFLTHFPRKMKAFYMEPDPEDPNETLSVDLLLPNVGEVLGGSMRVTDIDTLVKGFELHNISTEKYDWYIDQRRYGSCPHGGFGLGMERFIMYLTMQDTVKDCVPYPRYMGRISP